MRFLLRAGLLIGSTLTIASCRSAEVRPVSERDRLEVAWNPATGRGAVRHLFPGGDRLETCFQCGYPGYTGGLVIGSYSGSGLAFVPRVPLRGYSSINVLCATDESIWDHDLHTEYSFGWSENYGRGDDGQRLTYVRGDVLEAGPDRAVLESENTGGCYRVNKLATTRADARWWIIATRITNICDHPVHFDFFTGDDPWLGRYQSSDGDVGWSPDGLIERETEVVPFTSGGIYDLGNRALGQDPGPFSNQADFFQLDPAAPLPDRAFVANRFAHARSEIDPAHVLTNKEMIALNLGWVGRTLAPGGSLTVALAQGLAQTFEPGSVPQPPQISDADWSGWRQYEPPAGSPFAVEFAAEEVTLTLEEGRLTVDGRYHLRNPGDTAVGLSILYPVLSREGQPAPKDVDVDGRTLEVGESPEGPAVSFSVALAPRSLATFRVRYTQTLSGHRAAYRVTSARSWPKPITRALFEVRRPVGFSSIRLSYPVAASLRLGDRQVDRVVQSDFRPDRELEVEW